MIRWFEYMERIIRSSLQIQLFFLFILGLYFINSAHHPGSSFIILIIFLGVLFSLVQAKTRQLREMTKAAKQIAKGDLTFRVQANSLDEVGQLAEQINIMAAQLQQKIEAERQNEQMKNDLITNISHDLRTPLTSIIGYLHLLQEQATELSEENKKHLAVVYQKSKHLQELIENLFEFTKYTHHDVVLQHELMEMNHFIAQLVDESYPILVEENCQLIEHYHPTPCYMMADPSMIVRLLENLIQNAVRYSDSPKKVTIRVWQETEHVLISFRNPAKKVTPEQATQLFERFYRLDTSRSSKGSGIGLAIVKSITDLHQGKISAKVESGDILFTISFPSVTSGTSPSVG
ncbi:HAMP domain-containing sensor histidine kinase [Risungbinella massiliensis]|uniref:HAMP domain-containing sensor histidine kinase n=1 Tax=Risungbinella massiliensis TaxID=1329796 RepID=UPI0005CC4923|nr:HAMP domain-containing sensor histidine kinase [Risungbinella massiliensis]